ncbi:glycerol-3-phosphate dehydrogenase [Rhodovibrio salinarum]|uniref:Glycerol-3-phosphate dehydrogenase n=1 Tax=Rhodovibrio salinarum TaxID=1087 RepID=A0A934UXR8_9PROT|nr:glycerol-3-phosphate dehydrogenase [Rhodovibrio salinarum]MBK1695757.1 glycerol-3-phosphate dehydrogenase [Rhodovibrio salinarum]
MPAHAGDKSDVDLLVIGGGVNGAGVARDAAGRGLRVLLCEKGDLAEGTSSRSGKYIHGGLRYLEYYEFRLVREALIEREVLLAAAPHIVWPIPLVLPHSPEQRPRWLIRLGLFLYDHLGGRKKLPATRALDLRTAPEGKPLRAQFTKGFEYADCWVDDARLVILNAVDAARHGAEVVTRTACTSARREEGGWRAELRDETSGATREVRARAIVNTAGPWVEKVLTSVAGINTSYRVRLVKGSHIVTKRWWEGDHGYVLQNTDRRIIFVNPYQDDLALIGTTDIPFDGQPEDVAIDADEISYLLGILNRYFEVELTPADVLSSFSGVRPLFDDGTENASAVTRDYSFELDGGHGARAPILSAFGGKITTYRKLSEHALDRLAHVFPEMGDAWTERAPLPGGEMADADFDSWFAGFKQRHPWLPHDLALHYARLYGSDAEQLLSGAGSTEELGQHFGHLFYEREARWLVEREWARTPDDILDRRTKHGLFLSENERARFADWLDRRAAA